MEGPTPIQLKGRSFYVREAALSDLPIVLDNIRKLAVFLNVTWAAEATAEKLKATLHWAPTTSTSFDSDASFLRSARTRFAAALLACERASSGEERVCGSSIYYISYTAFFARPSVHTEHVWVEPEYRSHGISQILAGTRARLVVILNEGIPATSPETKDAWRTEMERKGVKFREHEGGRLEGEIHKTNERSLRAYTKSADDGGSAMEVDTEKLHVVLSDPRVMEELGRRVDGTARWNKRQEKL